MDHKGENMISGQNMVSGSLPIESGRVQGCFFTGKMAISGSGSSPIEFGRVQGCFFFWKNGNLGFWKQISGSGKWQSGILEANFRILEVTHRWIWIWIYPICDSMQSPVNKGEGCPTACPSDRRQPVRLSVRPSDSFVRYGSVYFVSVADTV